MCGITGIVSGNYAHGALVSGMLNRIGHRGVKASVQSFGKTTIGFTHLPITDIGKASQPYYGDWTVYLNGQIYNYKELGEGSECEVISKGLESEGFDFVKKLNGMFVIVAINKGNTFIIRDRFGIKPIYLYAGEDYIAFASEIKSFFALPDFEVKVNERIKERWLAFNNTFSDETIFEGVKMIHPATIANLNTYEFANYHQYDFTQTYAGSYKSAVSKVRELVINSIKRQTPLAVNYGLCLSGGIDSNIIRMNLPQCPAFTARFKGCDTERENAEFLNGKQYEILFSQVENLSKTIYHLEDLRVGASWSNYGLYELASKFVTVLFDGAGSDELFGGYTWRYDMSKNYVSDVLQRTSFSAEYAFADSIENRRLFDVKHFLQGVLIVCDKLSMAHTIEMRVPFLENELWDFCTTLPLDWVTGKKILKDAFPELPEQIKNAPKRGFSSPDWFEGEGTQADKWAKAAFNEWENIFLQ
jgi:asparagine synthase (glutamine-hydrolysing)